MLQNKRTFKEWVVLYIQGLFMGMADVIPGVSGGTMALVMGIYRELIEALSNLNLFWIKELLIKLKNRENPGELITFTADRVRNLKIPFFIILGVGILTAISTAGMVLPELMDQHPRLISALFFGLILGSLQIPARELKLRKRGDYFTAALVGLVFFAVAFGLTDPGRGMRFSPRIWVTVESTGETVEQLLLRTPLSGSPQQVAEYQQNLQKIPELAETSDLSELYLEAGNSLYLPVLPNWYLFLSGFVAIIAMILPGISGAYILLILGSYRFVLDLVRVFNQQLFSGQFAGSVFWRIGIFVGGMVLGLLIFSRLLRWFLDSWQQLTMAALLGLMFGGLRGLWPFNFLSDRPDTTTGLYIIGMIGIGIIFIQLFDYIAGLSRDRDGC